MLTPTTMESRQAFYQNNQNKTPVENAIKLHHEKTKLEKNIEQLEIRKLRLLEEIYELQKEFDMQVRLNKDLPTSGRVEVLSKSKLLVSNSKEEDEKLQPYKISQQKSLLISQLKDKLKNSSSFKNFMSK